MISRSIFAGKEIIIDIEDQIGHAIIELVSDSERSEYIESTQLKRVKE